MQAVPSHPLPTEASETFLAPIIASPHGPPFRHEQNQGHHLNPMPPYCVNGQFGRTLGQLDAVGRIAAVEADFGRCLQLSSGTVARPIDGLSRLSRRSCSY